MTRNKFIIASCAVICIVLIVWFVLPGKEEKARKQLDAAYKIEQSGQFDQAVNLYDQLIGEYAGTETARLAIDYIDRVKRYKDRLLVQESRQYLDRIALVLNGYREMMGTMPSSIEQLDSGAYMFDSDYMAEILPAAVTCYLRFGPETSSYILFSLKDGVEKAIRYEASGKISVINAALLDQEIAQVGLEKITKGRMIFLQPTKQ